MSHDDFEFEPQPGLPAPLPQGEQLLWQGAPNWKMLAIRAYHARKAAIYFAALLIWRITNGLTEGHSAADIAIGCLSLLLLGTAAVTLLCTLAYFSARSAVYSITSKRLLIRHGVAVPMTLNIPFKVIESADLKLAAHARGDIVLRLREDQRAGYLITWPYLRPGHITHPQPSLRALEKASDVADILGNALAASIARPPSALELVPRAAAFVPAETLPISRASAA